MNGIETQTQPDITELDTLCGGPATGRRSSPDHDANIGRSFGNYVLECVLGSGGMATVYQAVQPRLGKRVAVKVLHVDLARDQSQVARLIDEARATTAIGHENIVEVFDVGETPDGIHYIVMEHLEGETLQQRLDRHDRLPVAEAMAVAKPLCAALRAAHGQGIIHRDIKPRNLFLSRGNNGGDRLKVLDFGVAKLLDVARRTGPKTASGVVVGSPHYMAPEQARGEPVDGRADVYAVGALLYRTLSGVLPYDGQSYTEILANMLTGAPQPVDRVAPEAQIGPALTAVVARAMSRDPSARHPDMTTLAGDLDKAVAKDAAARPSSTAVTTAAKPRVDPTERVTALDAVQALGPNAAAPLGWRATLGWLATLGAISLGAGLALMLGAWAWAATAGAIALLALAGQIANQRALRRCNEEHRRLFAELERDRGSVAVVRRKLQRAQRLQRFLPVQLVEEVIGEGKPCPTGITRRKLTVVVATLESPFEHLGGVGPEDQARLLDRFCAIAGLSARQAGLLLQGTSGPTATFIAGAPIARSDAEDARAAARLALDLIHRFEEALRQEKRLGPHRVRLLPKVGVHSGYAMFGSFGEGGVDEGNQLQYLALGEDVAIAEALAEAAVPGSTLASAATRALLGRGSFGIDRSGSVEPWRGRKPVQTFRIEPREQ